MINEKQNLIGPASKVLAMKSETLPATDFSEMSVSDFKEYIKAIRRALGELPLPKGSCVRGEGDKQINKPIMNADPTRPVRPV